MSSVTEKLIGGRSETIALPPLSGNAATADVWMFGRRPEILKLLEEQLFGTLPPLPEQTFFETTEIKKGVFDGLGERRKVTLHFRNGQKELCVKALWYLPNQVKDHIPLVIGLNFRGNAACTVEEDIEPTPGEEPHSQVGRWQIPFLLKEGFSLIFAHYGEFYPDNNENRDKSIYALFHPASELGPEARQYTGISAWAWGYSRLLELGLTEPRIDSACIWAHGHSRLGKTALWCGAHDPRFSGIVSNCSGSCGASLGRDKLPGSEDVKFITSTFPWWFPAKMDQWAGNESAMPFDQHFLLSLIAPRPLLTTSATEDLWADPFNEFRAMKAIAPVYRLFGASALGDAHFPEPEQPVFGGRVGYYLRTGNHDVKATDWQFVVDFIRRNRRF